MITLPPSRRDRIVLNHHIILSQDPNNCQRFLAVKQDSVLHFLLGFVPDISLCQPIHQVIYFFKVWDQPPPRQKNSASIFHFSFLVSWIEEKKMSKENSRKMSQFLEQLRTTHLPLHVETYQNADLSELGTWILDDSNAMRMVPVPDRCVSAGR